MHFCRFLHLSATRHSLARRTAIDSVISVATGKELKGTGVWSWIKTEGGPASRAAIAAVLLSVVVVAASPELVSALTTDASINK